MSKLGRARALGGALLLFVSGACAEDPTREERVSSPRIPKPPKSSLLLVTLDTFRADAAGMGGDPRARTPHLDRLSRTGLQFETALAGSPLTLPSHASILTGRNGPGHGVRDNGTFRLPKGIPTLATELEKRGFKTAAFVAAFPLEERFGLGEGFEVYDDELPAASGAMNLSMAQRSGETVVRAARAFWESLDATQRVFTWLHLFDAHTPYDAPSPLVQATGDPYRADVALTDLFLGRGLRALPPETWVLILADHGEGLGEHGESTHGVFLYEATMRIPGLIWPAPEEERKGLVRGVFRTIDVPSTAFDLLGLPPEDAPGEGASGLAGESGPAYMEAYYAHYHYGWSVLAAIQLASWKYVEAPTPELYALDEDPGEKRNRALEDPDRARELQKLLSEARRETHGVEALVELDPATEEALRSLGYLTGAAVSKEGAPDPKDMITVQNLLDTAQAVISSGNWAEALGPLRAALSWDPNNKDVHQTLGLVYSALGRHELAADSFQQCLKLPPHENDRIPRFELASAYLRLGKSDKAAKELLILTKRYPSEDAPTWYNLGVAWERQGRHRDAREAWERALAIDPRYELAARSLGRVGSAAGTDR